VGVDSVWEQKNSKPRVREMLDAKRAARREAAVPCGQCTLCWATFAPIKTLIENDSAAHIICFYK